MLGSDESQLPDGRPPARHLLLTRRTAARGSLELWVQRPVRSPRVRSLFAAAYALREPRFRQPTSGSAPLVVPEQALGRDATRTWRTFRAVRPTLERG